MSIRSLLLVAVLALVALSTEAFSTAPAFSGRVASTTALDACRANAKKDKIKRNRDNMRKFATGKRGTSRRKTMKKLASNAARAEEAEFITKCFMTIPPPEQQSS